ncbi:hypothetical protein NQZ79_g4859 [Umbelopsis isabellina]|nr:hypothetical protein NQZ79_g4859 [Umbelopsis isabellina]
MAASDFSEGFGIVFLAALLLHSAWKNNKLNIRIEKPSDSVFASVISVMLVVASGYFAFQIFAADSTNVYKLIGEPFRIHPLLLRTKLHKYEEQIQAKIGLTAEQTFERMMGKDGMQLSYAVLGSLVFSYPYAESLAQLRIPMISILSRSYAIMLILISCGQAMPNRGLWKKWGFIGIVAIGIAQVFCLTNLQFLNLEGSKEEAKTKRALVAHQEAVADIDRHEVLVKIKGVALNFRNLSIKKGIYISNAMDDVIPCSDAAGNTAWNALYGVVPLKPGRTVLLLEYTGGVGVDYVIENGGAGTIEKSLQSTGAGGVVSLIGWLSTAGSEQHPEQRPEVASLVHARTLILRGIRVGSRQQQEELVQLASSRDLRVHVEKEFDFSDEGVNNVFDYLESANHIGKVCIKLA